MKYRVRVRNALIIAVTVASVLVLVINIILIDIWRYL